MGDLSVKIVLEENPVLPPPQAVEDFNAEADSDTQIDIGWTDPNPDTVDYTLERATNPLFTGAVPTTIPGAPGVGGIYHVTGLTAATLYYFRMRANNANGSSAWVTSSAATLP